MINLIKCHPISLASSFGLSYSSPTELGGTQARLVGHCCPSFPGFYTVLIDNNSFNYSFFQAWCWKVTISCPYKVQLADRTKFDCIIKLTWYLSRIEQEKINILVVLIAGISLGFCRFIKEGAGCRCRCYRAARDRHSRFWQHAHWVSSLITKYSWKPYFLFRKLLLHFYFWKFLGHENTKNWFFFYGQK